MILHRPLGSGHPYQVTLDQRWPIVPEAGKSAQLGVLASDSVVGVEGEFVAIGADGAVISEQTLAVEKVGEEPTSQGEAGHVAESGHLAVAQAGARRRGNGWRVFTPELEFGVTYRYRFQGSREDGTAEHTRWHELRAGRWEQGGDLDVDGVNRVIDGSVQTFTDGVRPWRVRLVLPLAPGEHVTGFGERYDTVDQRGQALDSVVFEQYKSQGLHRKTYMPMPFAHVIGGTGWGFHVETTRRVWFDVGAQNPGELQVEAEVGDNGQLTLSIFDGDPTFVLARFLDQAGRATELPDWVFKLWASGNEWNTQSEVMRQAALHKHHEIPVGTIVIEAWSDEATFTAFRDAEYEVSEDGSPHTLSDFTFPQDGAWPNPKAMVDDLHGDDVHVILWQIPLQKLRPHPKGQAAADAKALVAGGHEIREKAPNGSLRPYRNRGWWFPMAFMPDLTYEEAATWWTDKRRYLVEEVGIDGFKTDGGEHAWGSDLVYRDGSAGDAMNNIFPAAYSRAYARLMMSAGKAPVTFSRAGYTGSQPHGAFWAGDENSTWDAYRWSMNAGLNAAASGIVYWGWDIAGFSGDIPTAELYVRAMAASAFVPIMQYHSEFNHHRTPSVDRTPWNIAERTGDDRVVPLVRRFVQLREALIPYLRTQARLAIDTDRPLMRPLYFDHPGDDRVWRTDPQWMLGDDFLVSPVIREGVSQWSSYLPKGRWLHLATGQWFDGEQEVVTNVPWESIPVFAREGADEELVAQLSSILRS